MPYRLNSTIETAIWTWINSVIGSTDTVIWNRPNAPAPNVPYCVLSIVNGPNKIATDYLKYKTGTTYEILGFRTFRLNIECYGDNALSKLESISYSLNNPNYIDSLNLSGVAINSEHEIVDVSAELESGFEERAYMELLMSYGKAVEINLDIIESVEIHSDYENNGINYEDDFVVEI